jgi:purine-nucleoside phosphorylase
MAPSDFDQAAGCLPDECFRIPPDLGIMLGSGWGDALAMDECLVRVPYADIPMLGRATVPGHAGELIVYVREGKRIVAWCGRRHWYEGAGWESVVLPVEILRRMGAEKLLVTNAAGGINSALKAGDFVAVKDHINIVGLNPLIGAHHAEWGSRFPDMTEVYSRPLIEKLHACANRLDLRMMDGVYAFTAGPCYETPAEVRAYKQQGADVVGMSTVPEAVFAHACGIKVAAVSLVSNLAAGIGHAPLSHQEVIDAAECAKPRMRSLIDGFVARL